MVASAIAAAAGGSTSAAADWSQTLEASANGTYVTNPLFVPGSKLADESAVLSGDGNTTVQTERGQLSVTPRFSMTRYHRESDLDINAGSLDLGYVRKLERGQWTFSTQALTDSTVTSELGLTGITSVNRRHDAGLVSSSYQYFSAERLSWLLQGSLQLTRYSNAQGLGLTDYNYGSLLFGPTWSFSERLQGTLSLEEDRFEPRSGGTSQKDYSASLRLARSLGERYAWRAAMGATRIQSAGRAASTSSVLELGASWQGERIQCDLSVKRAVVPVGLGFLAREDQATASMVTNTSQRSTLSFSVGVIRTEPVTFLIYLTPQLSFPYQAYSGASWGQASAEWRYRLSGRWMLSAAYIYGRARSGELQPWANGNQARLGVVWSSGRL
jgi:hypothetical protein